MNAVKKFNTLERLLSILQTFNEILCRNWHPAPVCPKRTIGFGNSVRGRPNKIVQLLQLSVRLYVLQQHLNNFANNKFVAIDIFKHFFTIL